MAKEREILFTLSFWLCLVQLSSLWATEHVVEATGAEEFAPLVKLHHGQVRGLVHQVDQNDPQTRVYLYQGIRFATANRFEKPEPSEPWPDDYVYNATKEGNSCLQFIDEWDMDIAWIRHPTNHSEDCLFLDVYKPIKQHRTTNDGNDNQLLPVMVWIYGGGFQTGTIYTPIYDCSYLASIGEVIVVAINYRLGPLGFLYGGMEDAPGNQGFYDQIMGLQWIQNNIEAFGGDPKQVTVFGESAGAFSVSTLIISPLAKGLLQRAILQSGAITPGVLAKGKESSLNRTIEFGKKLDCKYEDDMKPLFDCLRNKSAEEIVKAGKHTIKSLFSQESFYPVFDDELLPEKAAKFELETNKVDLLFGVDHDEGTAFAVPFLPELMDDQMKFTLDQIKQKIRQLLRTFELPIKEDVVEFYTKNLNLSNANQIRKNIGDLVGDPLLVCPTLLFANQLADITNQSYRFYAYRFDRRSFIADKEECTFKWMGVCHGAEISYVFGTPILKRFPEDQKLSRQLIQAWTGFAKTGQPGSIGNAEWEEAYSYRDLGVDHRVMALDLKSEMISDPFKSCVDLWAEIFGINPKDIDHHQQQQPERWLNDVLKLDL